MLLSSAQPAMNKTIDKEEKSKGTRPLRERYSDPHLYHPLASLLSARDENIKESISLKDKTINSQKQK